MFPYPCQLIYFKPSLVTWIFLFERIRDVGLSFPTNFLPEVDAPGYSALDVAAKLEILWPTGEPAENTLHASKVVARYMCQGLNSHYFHIIGDGHQPNSRGL